MNPNPMQSTIRWLRTLESRSVKACLDRQGLYSIKHEQTHGTSCRSQKHVSTIRYTCSHTQPFNLLSNGAAWIWVDEEARSDGPCESVPSCPLMWTNVLILYISHNELSQGGEVMSFEEVILVHRVQRAVLCGRRMWLLHAVLIHGPISSGLVTTLIGILGDINRERTLSNRDIGDHSNEPLTNVVTNSNKNVTEGGLLSRPPSWPISLCQPIWGDQYVLQSGAWVSRPQTQGRISLSLAHCHSNTSLNISTS